jgi:hypothetical protein
VVALIAGTVSARLTVAQDAIAYGRRRGYALLEMPVDRPDMATS